MYGWNMQDHQARWYSIENITWSVIDAKSEINYSISPYAYQIVTLLSIQNDGKSKESELKAKYKMPYERIFNDKKKKQSIDRVVGIVLSTEMQLLFKANGCYPTLFY